MPSPSKKQYMNFTWEDFSLSWWMLIHEEDPLDSMIPIQQLEHDPRQIVYESRWNGFAAIKCVRKNWNELTAADLEQVQMYLTAGYDTTRNDKCALEGRMRNIEIIQERVSLQQVVLDLTNSFKGEQPGR